MRLPLVTRKAHNLELNILRGEMKSLHRSHGEVIEKLESQLDDVLPKLFKIAVRGERDYHTYKLVLAFDRSMIYDCFVHGNSQDMIHLLARRISREVEREMLTINFGRLE